MAWQIDPFGHSKSMINLYKNSDLDAIFLGRVDYQLKNELKTTSDLEFIWKDTSTDNEIFTVITPDLYIALGWFIVWL